MNISRRDFLKITAIIIASFINIGYNKKQIVNKNDKDCKLNKWTFPLEFPVYFPAKIQKHKKHKVFLPFVTRSQNDPNK